MLDVWLTIGIGGAQKKTPLRRYKVSQIRRDSSLPTAVFFHLGVKVSGAFSRLNSLHTISKGYIACVGHFHNDYF